MIEERLRGGDRRQLGATEDVVSLVLRDNHLFPELFEAMLSDDPVVRTRASDAAEKITRVRPDLLAPLRKRLISEAGEIDQPEVRWHVAQMLSHVRLDPKDRSKAIALLERYLKDGSTIVVVESMQTLVDYAREDRGLRRRLMPLVERMAKLGTPAMQTRARKLLARLEKAPEKKPLRAYRKTAE